MWMAMVDATDEMGTIRFASGSHEVGYLGPLNLSAESDERLDDLIRVKGLPVFSAGSMAARDATFHAGWTVHGAGANVSDTMREVMTVAYVEDGATVSSPDSPQREAELGRLSYLRQGDSHGGERHPLVYSSQWAPA